MPVFQLDLQKEFLGHFWTNRYFVLADDLADAFNARTDLTAGEQDIHTSNVRITKVRASTLTENDGVFLSETLNVAGTLSSSGNGLPLFNVVRVDWSAGTTRPARKFYRSLLATGEVGSAFQWTSGVVGTIQAALEAMQDALSTIGLPLVNRQGTVLGTPIVKLDIAMRQLRRGTRRQTEPII